MTFSGFGESMRNPPHALWNRWVLASGLTFALSIGFCSWLGQSDAESSINYVARQHTNWIGSGITESLATKLAYLPGLPVVPRDTVLAATRTSFDSPRGQDKEQHVSAGARIL